MSNPFFVRDEKKFAKLKKFEIREKVLMNQITPYLQIASQNPLMKRDELCRTANIQPGKVDRIRKELGIPSVFRNSCSNRKKKSKNEMTFTENNAKIQESKIFKHKSKPMKGGSSYIQNELSEQEKKKIMDTI